MSLLRTLRARLAAITPLRRAALRVRGLAGSTHGASTPTSVWTREELSEAVRLRQRAQAFEVFHTLWPDPPAPELLIGEIEPEATPLIMCLWNRPGQIDEILATLDAQIADDGPAPRIRLLLWNNATHDDTWYRERIGAFTPEGALASIEYVHSPHNIRGVARFLLARWLWKQGQRGSFLMLDDDEVIGRDALARLLAAGGERRIASFWAWRAHPDDYWQRERAAHLEPANYAATGGAVCDLEIIADDAFFTELPELGLFIEDAWMSRFALARGWMLRRCDIDVEFVLHETNQYGPLTHDKVAFWSSLKEHYPLPESMRGTAPATDQPDCDGTPTFLG